MNKREKHNNDRSTDDTLTGTVVSVTINGCSVKCQSERFDCLLGKADMKGGKLEVVVGDRVRISTAAGRKAFVEELLQRQSELWRSDPRPPHSRRVIAANVDLAVIVSAVRTPPLRLKLIDRYIVAAHMGCIRPVVCLSKIDLAEAADRVEMNQLRHYGEIGIPVLAVSAVTGEGMDELRELMTGRTCALVGHSGVGKSSILNRLHPGLDLPTNSCRRSDGKGRHTTTASNLYELPGGIGVIDTPGIREFGLHGVDAADLRRCFAEFDELADGCKYPNCTHSTEPDCAVKRAVRDSLISRPRYESYLKLLEDISPGAARRSEDAFECRNCGASVSTGEAGTQHRNHCPKCLWSVHLDNVPGDRTSCCGSLMEPVAVWVRKGGEWALIHRCRECGTLKSNRVAADDNEMLLLSLAARPLAQPPFPLEKMAG